MSDLTATIHGSGPEAPVYVDTTPHRSGAVIWTLTIPAAASPAAQRRGWSQLPADLVLDHVEHLADGIRFHLWQHDSIGEAARALADTGHRVELD